MNDIEHKKCFGKMFPDSLHLGDQTRAKGKVFSVRLTPSGGLSGPDRSVEIDVEEWDDCERCPEFASCFKLCLGKVTLESSISGL
jgi:hypothetical protein